jgi:DNA repair photolyase
MSTIQLTLFGEAPGLRIPERAGRAQVAEKRVKSILAKGTGVLAGVDYTLNPYVGCQFACSYCYAAFFQPPGDRRESWGQWVEVKANALELLRRERGIAGASIMVGSVTDPYQPIERETRLTRSLLEHLATVSPQPKIHIQTRSPFVVDDLDVLLRFERLTVGMSITTDDEMVRKAFEPQCASIGRRMEAVEQMSKAGIRTCISISPMLPVTDPERFARQLKELGAQRFSAGYFHENRGDFASGTRPGAWALARAHGWPREAYDDTVRRMKAVIPELKSWGR